MSAESEIASLSPAYHWPMQEAPASTVDGTVPIPNGTYSTDPAHPYHVETGQDPDGATMPCSGDLVAQPDPIEGDYRGGLGAYKPDADPADPWIESPEFQTVVPLSFGLFGSQPFTLLYLGSRCYSERLVHGTGPIPPDPDDCAMATWLWYGSGVASPGYEGTNGSWMGMGNVNNSGQSDLKAFIGVGPDGGSAGVASTGNLPSEFDARGLQVIVYDPAKPIEQRLAVWSDGDRGFATASVGDLESMFAALGAQDPQLSFFTGWDAIGAEVYVDEDFDDTFYVYPWTQTKVGLISNVALWDRALSFHELKDLWVGINGPIPDNDCNSWRGPGPDAIGVATDISDPPFDLNNFHLDGTGSHGADGSVIVSYQWNYLGTPISTDAEFDMHFPYADYGASFELQLVVTDDYGMVDSTLVTVNPTPPPTPVAGGWSVGHIGR